MRLASRVAAVVIAIAGLIDPAITRHVRAPRAIEFRLPPASDPQFAAAAAQREHLEREIGRTTAIAAGSPHALRPSAIVAIGNVHPDPTEELPVFAVPVPDAAGTSITRLSVSRRTMSGQSARVAASIRGGGLSGRTSNIRLEVRGVPLESVPHTWTRDDETFEHQWTFAPPEAGVYAVRVRVATPGVSDAWADDLVVARDEPLRVLVYEPRPSWPVTFVRRSLESDGAFEVMATARTSRPAVVRSSGAPRSLDGIDTDRFDVLVIGGLEELSFSDVDALDAFASARGGAVLLLPDRDMPAAVRRRLELPQAEEILLEKPLATEGSGPALRATELLLFEPAPWFHALAAVRHAGVARTTVVSVDRGDGRLIVSGALDAWRHRASGADDFAAFWRAIAADAALAAPRRIDVSVEPSIARPGDELQVTVNVRRTEVHGSPDAIALPPVAATLAGGAGMPEPLRLWPGSRLGTFTATLRAPATGRYILSASIDGASTDVPVVVDDDVVHSARDTSAAIAFAAGATGGAVLKDARQLAHEIDRLDAAVEAKSTRPMRSIWWIVAFTALLGAEWTLRRRSGLK